MTFSEKFLKDSESFDKDLMNLKAKIFHYILNNEVEIDQLKKGDDELYETFKQIADKNLLGKFLRRYEKEARHDN